MTTSDSIREALGRRTLNVKFVRLDKKYDRALRFTTSVWPTRKNRGGGRPTAANLTRYIEGTNESFLPGGVNDHLSTDGTVRILGAQIVNQFTGEVRATYNAAAFTVVGAPA